MDNEMMNQESMYDDEESNDDKKFNQHFHAHHHHAMSSSSLSSTNVMNSGSSGGRSQSLFVQSPAHAFSPSPDPVDWISTRSPATASTSGSPSTSFTNNQQSNSVANGDDDDEEEVVRLAPNVELSDFQFNFIDDYFTKVFEEESPEETEQRLSRERSLSLVASQTSDHATGSNDYEANDMAMSSFDSAQQSAPGGEIGGGSSITLGNKSQRTKSVLCIAVWRMDGLLYSASDSFLNCFNVQRSQQYSKTANLEDMSQIYNVDVNNDMEGSYSNLLHFGQIMSSSYSQPELEQVLAGKSKFFAGRAKLWPVQSSNPAQQTTASSFEESELEIENISTNTPAIDCHVSCYSVENGSDKFYSVSHVLIEFEDHP